MFRECLIDGETEKQKDYISACTSFSFAMTKRLKGEMLIWAHNLRAHHHGGEDMVAGTRQLVPVHLTSGGLERGKLASSLDLVQHSGHVMAPQTLRAGPPTAMQSRKSLADILRGASRSRQVDSQY